MEIYDLFYSWVPKYFRYLLLTLLAFVTLSANGIFIGNITDMYNSLGEYPEPFTMGFNALYIGMGLSMIFYIRMGTRFSGKTIVLIGLIVMLLMHIVIATTTSPALMVASCFVLGFAKVLPLGQVYLAWLRIWSKKMESAKLYPFLYFLALAGLYFMTWLMSYLAYSYDWQNAYLIVYALIAVTIITALFFVEKHPLKNSIPLYQADVPGMLFFGAFMMFINYVVVYGKVEDWFNSRSIIFGCFAAGLSLLLFIKRETGVKRPFLGLHLFTRNNFSKGLIYFMILGAFLPTTFQTSFSGGILHFESIRNSETNLYLIPGIAIGCLLSYFWYWKKFDGHVLMIIGFAFFTGYHVIMYLSFGNTFTLKDFWFPSIIKGFALSLLYITIGLYTTAKFGITEVLKISGTMVIVRSFLGSALFSGIYNYLLYSGRIKHLDTLASVTEANDFLVKQNSTNPDFYKNLANQATLASSKEISGIIIIFGLLLVITLLIFYGAGKIKKGILEQ